MPRIFDPAPIAVFAFNRPDHLRRTLQSLIACKGADSAPITVFIDGPKNPADFDVTEQVRLVASDILGSNAKIIVAETNQGLSKSVTTGVGALIAEQGRAIVVEDDLTLAPLFLEFMNAALDRYRDDERVYQISGHMFDVPEFLHRREALFLPFTTTWGWATWARAWRAYDAAAGGSEELLSNAQLRRRFDLDGCFPYSWLMERQRRGLSDSWGIRWYWSVFKRGGRCLFPPVSLVSNIGQDGTGTHGGGLQADFSTTNLEQGLIAPLLPSAPIVELSDLAAVKSAIWRGNGGWRGWLLQKIRQLVRR